MSTDNEISYLSTTFISTQADEPLTKAIERFSKNVREILVFDEQGTFLGYVTKARLVKESRLAPNSKVVNYISRVPTVPVDISLSDAARSILSGKHRSIPVEKNGKIIGIFRDVDILLHSENVFKNKTVEDLMSPNPIRIEPDTTIAQYIALCRNNNITRAPVTDVDNKLVGIISPHDITDLVLTRFPGQTLGDRGGTQHNVLATKVNTLMTTNVLTCKPDENVIEAIKILRDADHKALIVVDDDIHPIGILTTTDLLESASVPPKTKGYYVRVIGDIDDEDIDDVVDLGMDLVKKYASTIGTSGQLYIHFKAYEKQKFRGYVSYQVKMRIVTNKGHTYISKSEGYGLFGALNLAKDRLERAIVSSSELAIEQRESRGSQRYLLEEIAELEELE